MISNNSIRNCSNTPPLVQNLTSDVLLGKTETRQLFSQWNGQPASELDRPLLRIGNPNTDDQMRSDRVYTILHYLSFNPLNRLIELRHMMPQRTMNKVYIGQSLDESQYSSCSLQVDGSIAANDILIKDLDDDSTKSLVEHLSRLTKELEEVRHQLGLVKFRRAQPKTTHQRILDDRSY